MTSADLSAAPVRAVGTRSRAGNAMARTRAGLLEGALRAVEDRGTRRTTMNDIAASSGVAKATLYNHFRTKDDVWTALVEAEIRALAAECSGRALVDALATAAARISAHRALRKLGADEPAVLAALLLPCGAPGWQVARESVRELLAADGRAGEGGATELVLRWLTSYVTAPGSLEQIRTEAALLAEALPPAAD